MSMMYYTDFSPFHSFGFGPIFMFLFWGVVLFGLYLLLRRTDIGEQSRPMEILKERYAKGEITKEQFETIKKDLQ